MNMSFLKNSYLLDFMPKITEILGVEIGYHKFLMKKESCQWELCTLSYNFYKSMDKPRKIQNMVHG